jgi:hypothetical protein
MLAQLDIFNDRQDRLHCLPRSGNDQIWYRWRPQRQSRWRTPYPYNLIVLSSNAYWSRFP